MKWLPALLYRFRLRTAIPVAIVLFAAAVAVFIFQYTKITGDRDVEEEVSAELVQDMTALQGTLNRLLAQNDTTSAENELLNRGAETNFKSAMLIDEQGSVVTSTHIAEAGRSWQEAAPYLDQSMMANARKTMSGVVRISDDRRYVSGYFPVAFGLKAGELRPSRIGILYAHYDLGLQKALRHSRAYHRMIIMLLSMGGFAVLLWMFFYFSLSRRVTSLIKSAEQLASGQLDVRTGFHGKDEIATLGQTFDRMAEQVSYSDGKIRDLNRVYRVLSNVNQLIIRVPDQQNLFDSICRIAVEDGGFAKAWVGLIHKDTHLVNPVAVYGRDDGFLDAVLKHAPEGLGPMREAVMAGSHFVCGDLADESCVIPWRDEALKRGYLSTAIFPIKPRDASVAIVVFHSDSPAFFDDEEVRLLDELAADTSFSLWTIEQEKIRKQAEEAVQKSEANLKRAQEVAHVGSWYLDVVKNLLTWSDEAYRIFGIPAGTPLTYEIFLSDVHPDDRAYVNNAWAAALERKPYDIEHRIVVEGETKWVKEIAKVEFDENGNALTGIGTVQDITERKAAEEKIRDLNRVYRVLSNVNQLIIRVPDQQNLFDSICRIAVEDGGFAKAWVGLIDEVTRSARPVAVCGRNDGFPDAVLKHAPEGLGPMHEAIMAGSHFVCGDLADESCVIPWRDEALKRGYRSTAIFPIKPKDASVAIIAFHSDIPAFFDDEEVRLLDELAADTSFSLWTMEQEKLRKQAEEKVQQSEQKFRTIFDEATDGIILVDLDSGVFHDGNKTVCDMLGYSLGEIKTLGVSDIHPEEDLPYVMEQFERQMRREVSLAQDLPVKRKDGTVFYADINSTPMVLDGKTYMMGIFRDITERKQADEALKREQVLTKALFDSVPGMLYLYDDEGNLIRWNKQHETLTGYSAEELGKMHLLDWYRGSEEDIEVITRGVERCFAEGYAEADGNLQMKSGAKVLHHFTAVRLDIGGKAYFAGIGIDISARKLAEDALRASQNFLETIINTEPECVKLLSADGRLIMMNQAGLDMIDADSLDQVKGKSVFGLIAPEHREAFKALGEKVCQGGSGTLEFDMIGFKGRRLRLETHAVPLRNEKDEIIALLGVTRDITERKRSEDELRRLSQKNELILNSAGDGIYGVDVKGAITFINPAAAKMLGWETRELIGRQTHQTWHSIRPDGSAYPTDECPVMNALNRGSIQQTTEEVFFRKDGSSLPVEYTSTPMWEDSKLVGAVVTFKDITERKQAVEALKNEVAVTGALLEAANITSRNIVWEDVTGNIAGLVNELTAGQGVMIFQIISDGILSPLSSAGMPADSIKYFYTLRARVEDISAFNDVVTSKATLLLERDELKEFGLAGYAENPGPE